MGPNTWAQESADPGPKFGPEFTFWENGDQSLRIRIVNRATQHLVFNQQPKGKFSVILNMHTSLFTHFTSPNGWDFYIMPDPGVIEVTMRPLYLAEFERFAADMQDAIFATAANEGAFPALYGGGGHINIDGKYFLNRPLLLRNFLVDFINHAELSLGILNFDTNNALSFSLIPQYTYEQIVNLIEAYDEIGWSNMSINKLGEFLYEFDRILMTSNDSYKNFWYNGPAVRRSKYNEVNVAKFSTRTDGETRIEIRSVRPQTSMDVWVRQIRLIKKRLDYLNKFKEPIPIRPNFAPERSTNSIAGMVDAITALTPPISAHDALTEFQKYVTEAGENILDHLDYVWPEWISSGEVENFKNTLTTTNTCSSILESP